MGLFPVCALDIHKHYPTNTHIEEREGEKKREEGREERRR